MLGQDIFTVGLPVMSSVPIGIPDLPSQIVSMQLIVSEATTMEGRTLTIVTPRIEITLNRAQALLLMGIIVAEIE